MASSSDTEKLRFVLTVLKNTELAQPDFHTVAEEMGFTNANTAQKRFKAIVENAGFRLVNKQIVPDDEDTPPFPPRTPRKPPAKKPTTKAKTSCEKASGSENNKKRRAEMVISDDESDASDEVLKEENNDKIKMLGARAHRARSATVKAETVTEETDEEAD